MIAHLASTLERFAWTALHLFPLAKSADPKLIAQLDVAIAALLEKRIQVQQVATSVGTRITFKAGAEEYAISFHKSGRVVIFLGPASSATYLVAVDGVPYVEHDPEGMLWKVPFEHPKLRGLGFNKSGELGARLGKQKRKQFFKKHDKSPAEVAAFSFFDSGHDYAGLAGAILVIGKAQYLLIPVIELLRRQGYTEAANKLDIFMKVTSPMYLGYAVLKKQVARHFTAADAQAIVDAVAKASGKSVSMFQQFMREE